MVTRGAGAPSVRDALDRALGVLIPVLDIVDGRADEGAVPGWCERRGWTTFLLALDDAELARAERDGILGALERSPGAPADLLALARAVVGATHLPVRSGHDLPPPSTALQAVSARKRLQLSALLGAIGPMAEAAARIVDVGAGRGHLTRIASALFARDALGLERDVERVATASALAARSALPSEARFVAFDALSEPLDLRPDDLALGLHACGEVGDRLVLATAEAGCDLALLSCCLQKIEAPSREPLSRAATTAGLSLRKATLGLTNLSARDVGVETTLDVTLGAREARHALALLLRRRGFDVGAGEAMRGINRRRAQHGLRALAPQALALRGAAPPSEDELRTCEDEARADYARARRLSLPRSLLSRLTEVAVVLDRAAALEERGLATTVQVVVEPGVTPRNLGLFASRSAARLPDASG